MTIDRQVSKMFCAARVFALLSVVSAHISLPETFAGNLFGRIGSIGVVAFIIMSGYFYNTDKYSKVTKLIADKFVKLIVPWFFMASVVFAYDTILGHKPFSFINYFKWIIGNGTYFYYMTVLVMCYLIFYKTNRIILYMSVFINAVSLLLTATGIIAPAISALHITNYLNIFNWIGFFAIGLLLRKAEPDKIYAFFLKCRWIIIAAYNIALVLLLIFEKIKADYFSFIGPAYELLGVAAIFSLSTLDLCKYKITVALSNSSFAVYLVHIMFIALIDDYFSLSAVTRLLMPLTVVLLAFAVLSLGRLICEKIHLSKLYSLLTGIRKISYENRDTK